MQNEASWNDAEAQVNPADSGKRNADGVRIYNTYICNQATYLFCGCDQGISPPPSPSPPPPPAYALDQLYTIEPMLPKRGFRDKVGHMYGYGPGAYIRMAVQGRTIHFMPYRNGQPRDDFYNLTTRCGLQTGPLTSNIYDNGFISIYETRDSDALDGEPVVIDQTACARRCANAAVVSYKLKGIMIGPKSEINDLTPEESSYRCYCIMSSFCCNM